MNSNAVYTAIKHFCFNHDYQLQNCFIHNWEADYFSVTSSAYAYEYEIKISRSDFFADFKKPKHHFFKSFLKGYGIIKGHQSWRYEGYEGCHPDLIGSRIEYSHINPVQFTGAVAPNRFFFCIPMGLVKKHEIPAYAGLIECTESSPYAYVTKNAPYIHREKFNVKEMLFDKYYWKCRNMEKEVMILKSENMSLRERIDNLHHELKNAHITN